MGRPGGSLTLAGGAITGNRAGNLGGKIYLDNGSVGEDIVLRVRSDYTGVFAQAWGGTLKERDLQHFVSADPTCGIRLTGDGEAEMYRLPGNLTSVYSWAELNDALLNGENAILGKDISASAGDYFLGVPGGVSASLDLNGYTIDGSSLSTNYTLVLDGDLTLKDSRSGGGIHCDYPVKGVVKVQHGTLTISGRGPPVLFVFYSLWHQLLANPCLCVGADSPV